MTKNSFKKLIVATFIIISLTSVIYFSYKVITWKLHIDENNNIKKQIENNITTIESESNKDKEVKYDIDFKKLKETNKDTIAYLKVNNTNIDYVVVKGKDNSYYLKHNFEKKWNVSGWIFADYHNKFDETDKNIIIYGHNTRDGSMFGTLKNILDKEWYENKENHKVILVTEKGQYEYQVFSSYSIVPEDYYINTIFKNNDDFNIFIMKLKSRSIYDYGVNLSGSDKILTLSSCTAGGTKRVVLHAKLINSNE